MPLIQPVNLLTMYIVPVPHCSILQLGLPLPGGPPAGDLVGVIDGVGEGVLLKDLEGVLVGVLEGVLLIDLEGVFEGVLVGVGVGVVDAVLHKTKPGAPTALIPLANMTR